jgi:antitoxin (DNA-binding transcriptional repressor) of toxin-antitoxin stability system
MAMLAKRIDVQKSQPDLNELLTLVREGTEVILTEGDTMLARIVPIETPTLKPRVPDLYPGIWISDDFDEPLPDEFWLGEE